MTISKRLMAIADTLRICAADVSGDIIRVLADVGTDHALLPIYAVKEGIVERCVISDVRKGPLDTACRNIARHEVQHLIDARLCSGLRGYKVGECDVIVIAGMGGTLISEILEEAVAEGFVSFGQLFVLQPNTMESELRQFLSGGFDIRHERAVSEDGHVYLIIYCIYDGVKRTIDEISSLLGHIDELPLCYYEKLKRMQYKRLQGILSSRSAETQWEARRVIESNIRAIESIIINKGE